MERRDKLGRRIGYNWWREMICQMLSDDEALWQSRRESGTAIGFWAGLVPGAEYDTAYYQLTEDEYRKIWRRPTLREFLETQAGHHVNPAA